MDNWVGSDAAAAGVVVVAVVVDAVVVAAAVVLSDDPSRIPMEPCRIACTPGKSCH